MKLSKKREALQRSIHKAVASGKTLGGLLVGLAATVAGCREHRSPVNTMGEYPAPFQLQEENTMKGHRRAVPGEPPIPQPAETNVVNEHKSRKTNCIPGKTPLPVKDKSK